MRKRCPSNGHKHVETITYLHLFKVLVLFHVKTLMIVKTKVPCLGHSLQTVQHGNIIGTCTRRRVMKWRQRFNRWQALRSGRRRLGTILKLLLQMLVKTAICLFWCAVQIEHLISANQENGVGAFRRVHRGIEADNGKLAQLVIEFGAEPSQLPEIERTKVEKEIPIDELIVNVEKVNLLLGTRRRGFVAPRRGCQNVVRRRRLLQGSII